MGWGLSWWSEEAPQRVRDQPPTKVGLYTSCSHQCPAFTHPFNKYLLNVVHVLGTGIDFGDITGERPDKNKADY